MTRNPILISYSYLPYCQMDKMFWDATAFNQPLSSFDTAKVTRVSAYLCRVRLDEKPDSDFLFLPALLSDESNVRRCHGLQSGPIIIRYFFGYICESYLCRVRPDEKPDSDFLFYPSCLQMSYMFWGATAFNQDLCHFGDNWPHSSVFNMFADSGCASTSKPEGVNGPWCASTCPSS